MEVPLVKTPLGIIALFVALIELFLAYPVTQLAGNERMILLAFMTLFPTFVAASFFYILWHKPIHLYSPEQVTPGLENRYQAAATRTAELEVQNEELNDSLQRLLKYMEASSPLSVALGATERAAAAVGAASLATADEQRTPSANGPGAAEPAQQTKRRIEEAHREARRSTAQKVQRLMTRFRKWLAARGFTTLPEIPEIVIEPEMVLNAWYDPSDRTAHFGGSIALDPDVVAATYVSAMAGETNPDLGTSDGHATALLWGFADYLACAYNGDPRVGEEFAEVAGRPEPWLRNLEQIVELPADSADPYAATVTWGGALWELRQRLDADTLDSVLPQLIRDLPPGSTIPLAAQMLAGALAARDPAAAATVRDVFAKRGVQIPEAADKARVKVPGMGPSGSGRRSTARSPRPPRKKS